MQHGNSQQSNPGQSGPPTSQGQPGQPPQMRPQSRTQNDQQTPVPQQAQPQPPQEGPPQHGTPQQNQQGNQPSTQQQAMSQRQQQQMMQQQQRMNQQRAQQMQARQLQMAQQNASQAQAQVQGQQQQSPQQPQPGALILKLNQLCDHLSNFDATTGKNLELWSDFTDKFFAPEGRLLHSFNDDPSPGSKSKVYEVLRQTIHRYFWTYFDQGALSLRLHTEHAREMPMMNGRQNVSCSSATLTVTFPGARLEMTGSLNAWFSHSTQNFDVLEIQQTSTEETISRAEIERVLTNWSPQMDTKSPKMAKNKIPKAQQKLQQQMDRLSINDFRLVPRGTMGVTSRVQQFLELGEAMTIMAPLMQFSQEKKLRPEEAVELWTAENEVLQQQQQQIQLQQGQQQSLTPQIQFPVANGVPVGGRTPSMGNMAMPNNGQGQAQFASPALSHMGLPMQNGVMGGGSPHISHQGHPGGAPGLQPPQPPQNMALNMLTQQVGPSHTPSPRQGNMAAPQMLPQHSAHGTNSSQASANTSPQVSNKRRRSMVKAEEEGGGEGQGQGGGGGAQGRVKPSPRGGKKGKPGGG
ncbi:hypothetical protein LTR78_010701 [Recurvomyces mirabilis]|uniref:LIM-domain binding protein-domain-containing protein n=3 Tax=Recurvomyces mirabilis TaxID=574656 RepID=A0AAE0WEZ2_9PEZI|nr:hypothetical protein LTR78_010701 [Recurvomyces mirabilis]